ncbi:cysteine hydrolase [Natronospirillum operosum]|uniref:Cysteine hydrolase n=1 Tax=Natronospirillum operosum TaxID=2759953 RepID=A0A4Z0WEZ2_9GAMM|nr:cysteine hydrolase family protein [Natronospirillum operosum]TGG92858.1 cysteine hydrolase [Natronospirillum operosum]
MKDGPISLIVVDMQKGMKEPAAGVRNNPDAERNILTLLTAWRNASWPVVHVRHISRTPDSPFWPGRPGAEFQPELAPLDDEHVVEKNVPDAFVHTGLERWLHVRGLGQVVIVGVSTNHSIESTARSAGNLGFKTTVVSDATFTFAQEDYAGIPRTADEVHAMSLANLAGEYTTIVSAAEALKLPGSRRPL